MTRWCDGPCGRERLYACFPLSRHGNPENVCITCKRFRQRESRRRRYRTISTYRAHVKALRRYWYTKNATQERAASVRRRDKRKQEAAA